MARTHRKHAPQEHVEETRNAILRVAHHLFMTYGYRAVTTRQLAEACGLTQPALYHHFADKEALYLAVVTEELAKMKAALERITRRPEGVPERLKHLASFLLSRVQYDLGLMLHDVRYELSPEVRTSLGLLFHESVIAPIAALFEEGIHQGTLRDPEHGGITPVLAASLLMNVVARFAALIPADASAQVKQMRRATSAEQIVQLLFYGIAHS